MGQIDVTDILADPDFVDQMQIVHRSSTVNEFGKNILCEQGVPTWGTIQPASDKQIQRVPDDLKVADLRGFWVQGKIVSDGKCQYPDVLVFNGLRYLVQKTFDWTNWGSGWTEGVCIREKAAL